VSRHAYSRYELHKTNGAQAPGAGASLERGSRRCFRVRLTKRSIRYTKITFLWLAWWIFASILLTTGVLFLNLILVIVSATTWNAKDGIAAAFTGNCTTAARWTTGIHLIINLLGSVLLGASNYCMQRLVAPSRRELDAAHARKKLMDIGAPSVRNLFLIGKGRVAL
jgi:hypothetical protein